MKQENEHYYFTSESVTEGHPDKIADQISDGILDAILAQDPQARVACETIVNTGLVVVLGEITTTAYVDIQNIAREVIRDIGYTDRKYGFDADNVAVLVSLDEQSPDIAQGVDHAENQAENEELGAGDQGIMFGYATRETPELMPLAISLSHQLARRLAQVRKDGTLPYLGPDGKTQVTLEYDAMHQVQRVDNIVVSSQHDESVTLEQLKSDLIEHVVRPVIPEAYLDDKTVFWINPTGKFVIGGPVGDSGLTGRKIIVDTYGGASRHGGGAFSGKDATKVDRSGSYVARYIAKNLVAAGLCDRCEVQLAYAIGVSEPTSIMVDSFGTSEYAPSQLAEAVRANFDLTPLGMIQMLDLRRPQFLKTAAYGHFGREDEGFRWEETDRVDALRQFFQK